MTNSMRVCPNFGIRGYRSYFGEMQFVVPTAKVTAFAGPNNSGKSNLLRFVQLFLPRLEEVTNQDQLKLPTLSGFDIPVVYNGVSQLEAALQIADEERILERFGDSGSLTFRYVVRIIEASSLKIAGSENGSWVCLGRSSTTAGQAANPDVSLAQALKVIDEMGDWQQSYERVLIELGGGFTDPVNVMQRLLVRLLPVESIPPVVTIDATRRIEPKVDSEVPIIGTSPAWISGRDLIGQLAILQNPPIALRHANRQKFEQLNRFLQEVLENRDFRIAVPRDESTIQVDWMGEVYPLENMGGGIPQLVIIATAAAVALSDHLICIEEPETNLHPIQQKKLLRFLAEETSNQYMFATHSAHFLDSDYASVFHLRFDNDGTTITHARQVDEFHAILADLGYRASDLLQANCIIWVEGPSDRIYLRGWLSLIAPELIEGVDYSIMFYGGKLLTHLSVDYSALADFINLRRLNAHSAIMIDSDRSALEASLSQTKKRLVDEFSTRDPRTGFAWVTDCYTIENYVDRELLARSLSAIHRGRTLTGSDERWDNPLAGDGSAFDKIAIAREVVNNFRSEQELDRWDLRDRMNLVARFIRHATGD